MCKVTDPEKLTGILSIDPKLYLSSSSSALSTHQNLDLVPPFKSYKIQPRSLLYCHSVDIFKDTVIV